jgi:hypothetical protein
MPAQGPNGRATRYRSIATKGIDPMTIDGPQEISTTKASGGVKLGAMRYVLGLSIVLAAIAGVVIWNIYAIH